MTKTTLTYLEELFSSRLEAVVQDGFGKHLTGYAHKGNTMVVVTTGMATFLVQRQKNQLTLPVLRDSLSCPDCVKDGLEPADGYLSSWEIPPGPGGFPDHSSDIAVMMISSERVEDRSWSKRVVSDEECGMIMGRFLTSM